MSWTGPALVDHHTHLLRVSGGGTAPWASDPSIPFADAVGAYHRGLLAAGSTPMDEPAVRLAAGEGEPLAAALEAGLQRARDLGLAQVSELGMGTWDELDALLLLRQRGDLPCRVRLFVSSGLLDRSGGAAAVTARRTGDAQVEVEGVKLYADGWLGPRTCALCRPFADRPDDAGILFLDGATIARRTAPLVDAGLRVATHAIGDRAIEAVLAGYEAAFGGDVTALRAAALRIEHAQVLHPDLVAGMAELGVVACIQPSFATSDADAAQAGLGPDRAAASYVWQDLIDAGVRVIAGSDFPIEDLDPMIGLRRLASGAREPGGDPIARRLDAATALSLCTDADAGTTTWSQDPRADLDGAAVVTTQPSLT